MNIHHLFFWIKNSFLEEKNNWVLWIPVIFAQGIIFYFSISFEPNYLLPSLLLLFSIALSIALRRELLSLVAIAIGLFLLGFLWAKFYSNHIAYTHQIQHKLYAVAIGKVDTIKSYQNKNNSKKISRRIVISDLELYKTHYNKKTAPNKPKRKSTKAKISNKTIIKHYFNLKEYQKIDRQLQSLKYNFDNDNWRNNKYLNPPKKISIYIRNSSSDIKIGDLIKVRVLLEAFKKPNILGGYDFAYNAYFKQIGANGYAIGNIQILQAYEALNLKQNINKLRDKIAINIINNSNKLDTAGIAIALLVGIKDYIPKTLMADIRNSGLAHLLAISGLHLTLAASIFFLLTRFILSNIEYLTLNYDIKKISAIIAIIAGFAYLLITGMTTPAIRAFIMTTLVFVAILLDRNPNILRSIALAALTILILSPYIILSASFQLSFAAILLLTTFYNYIKKYQLFPDHKPFYLKFIFYFIAIAFSSIIAQIAITPFSIYHFNSYVQYGIIANLIAIPITSLLTMPLGFLSLFLMPFGLEKLALYPMSLSIDMIIATAQYVAQLPLAHHRVRMISPLCLSLIIISGLWFCLWQKGWRYLAIITLILAIYLGFKTPLPDLLIDGDKKFFALYNQNNGLVFSKKIRSKSQRNSWMKKMGEEEYKIIANLSPKERELSNIFCQKQYCQLNINNHQILILTARNKNDFICQNDSDIIINMTKKYQMPDCNKTNFKTIIDNIDLSNKGGHFLYLGKEQLPKIKTIIDSNGKIFW